MAENKNDIQGFDWDDLFTGEESRPASSGGFTYLAPGIYPFTVEEIEKTQSKSGKNMLRAELIFQGEEGKSKVFFNTTIKDQVQSFLMCIGALRKGQSSHINWADLLDRDGRACIKDSTRKSDKGVPFSEVHYFILPDDAELEW